MISTTPLASDSWDLIGDSTFYRKQELYSLESTRLNRFNFNDYILVAAKDSGPIALMRDTSKPILITQPHTTSSHSHSSSRSPKIEIYSTAGHLIQTIEWLNVPSKIVQLGWTDREELIVLLQDSTFRIYPLYSSSHSSHSDQDSSTFSQHSLLSLEEQREDGLVVLQAKIYESGMVVLLSNLQFLQLKGWNRTHSSNSLSSITSTTTYEGDSPQGKEGGGNGRIQPLARITLERLPDSWNIITPESSQTRGVEVLIGVNETVWRLDEIECQDQRLTRGPYLSITPSPSGRFLALLTRPSPSTLILWVTSSDFSRSLSEYKFPTSIPSQREGEEEDIVEIPNQIEWCGSNSVICSFDRTNEVVMIGPFGETLTYHYSTVGGGGGEGGVKLIGERDGTRILTNEVCDFVQIVPPSTQRIFLPGSTHPSAILYEASLQFLVHRSPKADEYVRSIRERLTEAVEDCLDAAGKEWSEGWQKKLLQAAAFGKSFLEVYNPTRFVETTKSLRILNQVRRFEIGLPITIEQYNSKPLSHLISRLTSRSQYLLALRISQYLGLSPTPVLRHWAQSLIVDSSPSKSAVLGNGGNGLSMKTDEEVCRIIVEKLSNVNSNNRSASTTTNNSLPSIQSNSTSSPSTPISSTTMDLSSADIALTAFTLGRNRLALMLIEHELKATKKVSMLVKMGEVERGLKEAEESGDPDLVYSVLLPLLSSRSSGDVFRILPPYPLSTSLLQLYARENDSKLLRDFYYVEDRRWQSGVLELEESFEIQTTGGGGGFGERVEKVRKSGKRFGEDKEYGFESKMMEEQVKLLILQQTLESESPDQLKYVGLSVNETMRRCIGDGTLEKKVDKIKKDFNVPDKRFWYVKLKSLISLRDWDALETFSRSRKSPIGYEPWVEALISAGAQRQAVKYVERCEARNRVELFVKCGEWVMAGQEAVRRGERGKLLDLKSRSPNNIIAAQLDDLMQSMDQSGM